MPPTQNQPGPLNAVLAAAMGSAADDAALPARVCAACVASMPVDGAALVIIDKTSRPERVGSSDPDTERVEELQAMVGEGPAFSMFETAAPVLVPDVRAADTMRRWPAFTEAIAATRMRAVFVLPVQIGAVGLGALALYRHVSGPLPSSVLADALRVADLIAMLFVGRKGDLVGDFADRWLDESSWAREVHQATGMLITQLGVGAEEAFVRLRAYAFGNGLTLSEVARAIVGRRLRFDEAN